MGWVCLVKKPQKNMWSAYCARLFGLCIREMGSTGKWNWSGSCEDYDSCFALHCSVHLHASVQGAGVKHCTSGW